MERLWNATRKLAIRKLCWVLVIRQGWSLDQESCRESPAISSLLGTATVARDRVAHITDVPSPFLSRIFPLLFVLVPDIPRFTALLGVFC